MFIDNSEYLCLTLIAYHVGSFARQFFQIIESYTFYYVKDECLVGIFFTDWLASLSPYSHNSLWYIEQIQFTLPYVCSKNRPLITSKFGIRIKCGNEKLLLNRVKNFTFSIQTKFSKISIIVGYVKQRKHFCMMSAMRP